MISKLKLASITVFAGVLMSTSAFGTTVGAGSFQLAGEVVGIAGATMASGLDFYASNGTGANQAIVSPPETGIFASGPLALTTNTLVTMQNLTAGGGVIPGTSFDFANWIQLSDGINLDITSIPIPSDPVCTSSSVGPCLAVAGSPVVLTQAATGVNASIAVSGFAHFAGDPTLTPFVGLFGNSTSVAPTIASLETQLSSTGQFGPIGYTANFVLSPTATTPEPAAIFLASFGLVGLGLLRKRKASN